MNRYESTPPIDLDASQPELLERPTTCRSDGAAPTPEPDAAGPFRLDGATTSTPTPISNTASAGLYADDRAIGSPSPEDAAFQLPVKEPPSPATAAASVPERAAPEDEPGEGHPIIVGITGAAKDGEGTRSTLPSLQAILSPATDSGSSPSGSGSWPAKQSDVAMALPSGDTAPARSHDRPTLAGSDGPSGELPDSFLTPTTSGPEVGRSRKWESSYRMYGGSATSGPSPTSETPAEEFEFLSNTVSAIPTLRPKPATFALEMARAEQEMSAAQPLKPQSLKPLTPQPSSSFYNASTALLSPRENTYHHHSFFFVYPDVVEQVGGAISGSPGSLLSPASVALRRPQQQQYVDMALAGHHSSAESSQGHANTDVVIQASAGYSMSQYSPPHSPVSGIVAGAERHQTSITSPSKGLPKSPGQGPTPTRPRPPPIITPPALRRHSGQAGLPPPTQPASGPGVCDNKPGAESTTEFHMIEYQDGFSSPFRNVSTAPRRAGGRVPSFHAPAVRAGAGGGAGASTAEGSVSHDTASHESSSAGYGPASGTALHAEPPGLGSGSGGLTVSPMHLPSPAQRESSASSRRLDSLADGITASSSPNSRPSHKRSHHVSCRHSSDCMGLQQLISQQQQQFMAQQHQMHMQQLQIQQALHQLQLQQQIAGPLVLSQRVPPPPAPSSSSSSSNRSARQQERDLAFDRLAEAASAARRKPPPPSSHAPPKADQRDALVERYLHELEAWRRRVEEMRKELEAAPAPASASVHRAAAAGVRRSSDGGPPATASVETRAGSGSPEAVGQQEAMALRSGTADADSDGSLSTLVTSPLRLPQRRPSGEGPPLGRGMTGIRSSTTNSVLRSSNSSNYRRLRRQESTTDAGSPPLPHHATVEHFTASTPASPPRTSKLPRLPKPAANSGAGVTARFDGPVPLGPGWRFEADQPAAVPPRRNAVNSLRGGGADSSSSSSSSSSSLLPLHQGYAVPLAGAAKPPVWIFPDAELIAPHKPKRKRPSSHRTTSSSQPATEKSPTGSNSSSSVLDRPAATTIASAQQEAVIQPILRREKVGGHRRSAAPASEALNKTTQTASPPAGGEASLLAAVPLPPLPALPDALEAGASDGDLEQEQEQHLLRRNVGSLRDDTQIQLSDVVRHLRAELLHNEREQERRSNDKRTKKQRRKKQRRKSGAAPNVICQPPLPAVSPLILMPSSQVPLALQMYSPAPPTAAPPIPQSTTAAELVAAARPSPAAPAVVVGAAPAPAAAGAAPLPAAVAGDFSRRASESFDRAGEAEVGKLRSAIEGLHGNLAQLQLETHKQLQEARDSMAADVRRLETEYTKKLQAVGDAQLQEISRTAPYRRRRQHDPLSITSALPVGTATTVPQTQTQQVVPPISLSASSPIVSSPPPPQAAATAPLAPAPLPAAALPHVAAAEVQSSVVPQEPAASSLQQPDPVAAVREKALGLWQSELQAARGATGIHSTTTALSPAVAAELTLVELEYANGNAQQTHRGAGPTQLAPPLGALAPAWVPTRVDPEPHAEVPPLPLPSAPVATAAPAAAACLSHQHCGGDCCCANHCHAHAHHCTPRGLSPRPPEKGPSRRRRTRPALQREQENEQHRLEERQQAAAQAVRVVEAEREERRRTEGEEAQRCREAVEWLGEQLRRTAASEQRQRAKTLRARQRVLKRERELAEAAQREKAAEAQREAERQRLQAALDHKKAAEVAAKCRAAQRQRERAAARCKHEEALLQAEVQRVAEQLQREQRRRQDGLAELQRQKRVMEAEQVRQLRALEAAVTMEKHQGDERLAKATDEAEAARRQRERERAEKEGRLEELKEAIAETQAQAAALQEERDTAAQQAAAALEALHRQGEEGLSAARRQLQLLGERVTGLKEQAAAQQAAAQREVVRLARLREHQVEEVHAIIRLAKETAKDAAARRRAAEERREDNRLGLPGGWESGEEVQRLTAAAAGSDHRLVVLQLEERRRRLALQEGELQQQRAIEAELLHQMEGAVVDMRLRVQQSRQLAPALARQASRRMEALQLEHEAAMAELGTLFDGVRKKLRAVETTAEAHAGSDSAEQRLLRERRANKMAVAQAELERLQARAAQHKKKLLEAQERSARRRQRERKRRQLTRRNWSRETDSSSSSSSSEDDSRLLSSSTSESSPSRVEEQCAPALSARPLLAPRCSATAAGASAAPVAGVGVAPTALVVVPPAPAPQSPPETYALLQSDLALLQSESNALALLLTELEQETSSSTSTSSASTFAEDL